MGWAGRGWGCSAWAVMAVWAGVLCGLGLWNVKCGAKCVSCGCDMDGAGVMQCGGVLAMAVVCACATPLRGRKTPKEDQARLAQMNGS